MSTNTPMRARVSSSVSASRTPVRGFRQQSWSISLSPSIQPSRSGLARGWGSPSATVPSSRLAAGSRQYPRKVSGRPPLGSTPQKHPSDWENILGGIGRTSSGGLEERPREHWTNMFGGDLRHLPPSLPGSTCAAGDLQSSLGERVRGDSAGG